MGDDTVLFFNEKGVFRLDIKNISSELARDLLAERPDAWALVDCNADMTSVPSEITKKFKFIVQAASPREEHFEDELLLSGTLFEPELDRDRLIHFFQ
ncbi:hypothetical protein BV25DRAFT_376934 [Artomyces pyxidatus]|uniref:Uncharacterized protein n=1 Tax=Artomyces pyxidatus TaxID=48021 RepID=A0ACB8SF10_9AGAM|nr:hypothetical protein BV25DRAFT_376934 [Artomyces pyxidatus]